MLIAPVVSCGLLTLISKPIVDRARLSKVESQLKRMEHAIAVFYRDYGFYPTLDEFNRMPELGYWNENFYEHAWGRFIYEPPTRPGEEPTLRCLGRDNKVGGAGLDGDFTNHDLKSKTAR